MEEIQGIAVFTEGNRSAKPLVFIHGFPMDHSMWKPQTDYFSKTCFVVSYDVRGLGRSRAEDGQYTLESYVDDLFAVMDGLKIGKAVVCGLSMGGYIALRGMERQPERFSGLVLCDTRSEADSDEAKVKRAGTVGHLKKTGLAGFAQEFVKSVFSRKTLQTRPDFVEAAAGLIRKNSVTGVCGALLALAARTDTTRGLEKISVPTLVLVGQEDKITPPSAAEAMQKKIPGALLRAVPDASHFSNLDNPEVFNGFLDAFFRNIQK